jgi:uncharacterized membrane protein
MEHAAGAAPAWLLWLQEGSVGQAMRQSPLLYPVVEILHIVGFALLVGAIIGLDLRLLGGARWLSAQGLARHLLRLAVGGFCLAAPMGALLFVTEAVALAQNTTFLAKLVLIALAGANAVLFHLGAWRGVAGWDLERPPAAARVAGAVSMSLWLAVLACGRLIAYS